MATFANVILLPMRPSGFAARRLFTTPLSSCRPISRSFSVMLRPNASQRPVTLNASPSFVLGTRTFFSGKPAGTTPTHASSENLKELETIPSSLEAPVEPTASIPDDVLATNFDTLPAPFDSSLVSAVTDAVSATSLPMNYGDLASLGLANYTPAGLIQWSLEYLHVATQLPWFWTIVIGASFWRAIIIPITIMGARNSEFAMIAKPETDKLAEKSRAAIEKGDMEQAKEYMRQQRAVLAEHGVSTKWSVAALGVQLPLMLGAFYGIKRMCDLPVEQLKVSGMEWLPDLTVADPTLFLSVLFFGVVNLSIHLSKSGINTNANPLLAHGMNFGHVLSFFSLYAGAFWPSGLVLAMISGTATNMIQILLVRTDTIRKLFGFPPRLSLEERGTPPTPRETFNALRGHLEQQKLEAERLQREQKFGVKRK